MSVSTRKQTVSAGSGLGDRLARAGRPVGTLAGKTVPLAQNATTTVWQGAGSAIARAAPAVDAARSWTAPQLEQSAHAITDTIAPMISEALLAAAHKIDVPRPPRRRVPAGMVAGAVALTAAAGAASFAAIRMRKQDNGLSTDSVTTTGVAPPEPSPREESGPDADGEGGSRIV